MIGRLFYQTMIFVAKAFGRGPPEFKVCGAQWDFKIHRHQKLNYLLKLSSFIIETMKFHVFAFNNLDRHKVYTEIRLGDFKFDKIQ